MILNNVFFFVQPLPPWFTFQKTQGDRILRSPRRGTGTAPRFAKPQGGVFSRGSGGGRRPSASLCGNPLVSPMKAKIPAGAFAKRAAIPVPSPSFPLKGKYQK